MRLEGDARSAWGGLYDRSADPREAPPLRDANTHDIGEQYILARTLSRRPHPRTGSAAPRSSPRRGESQGDPLPRPDRQRREPTPDPPSPLSGHVARKNELSAHFFASIALRSARLTATKWVLQARSRRHTSLASRAHACARIRSPGRALSRSRNVRLQRRDRWIFRTLQPDILYLKYKISDCGICTSRALTAT